ncbi:hypothetical protein EYC84_009546 [Monilinia fructicola]|uniref:Uncharacterized protein n=1 Tax=Monilinia fructicola TaxID=38448 RepID=A0A5M9JCS7_MONFR|nr:hypothetical protein EYC84_009546 [Monilinia fructicola]
MAGQSRSHLVFGRSARESMFCSMVCGLEFESTVRSLASAVVFLLRLNIVSEVLWHKDRNSCAIDIFQKHQQRDAEKTGG